jgi:signal transduction histidine kinase
MPPVTTPTAAPGDLYPRLLSLAVHELRTPISVVGGYLRLLQHPNAEPLTDHQRKMIAEAEKSCARLGAVIGELSDIAKLDSGQLPLVNQPLDVFALVDEVATRVHEAQDRDVHLQVSGEAIGAAANGDPGRLRSAFDAVFRAILREKPGPCTVTADRRRIADGAEPCAVVIIADAADVQDVYDSPAGMFDEKRGGLGLALPLARRVIERHGGRIWSPAPRGAADDPRARGSAVISLPITERT